MRVGRSLVELSLQRPELRVEPGHLRVQPCDLLLQGGIAGGLGGAARAPGDGLACVHVPVLGACRCI